MAWAERPLDVGLITISLLAVTFLGSMEVLSGPQLATRVVLGAAYRLANESGIRELYEFPATWRGWYSLEIGVEITASIVLGFLVWLLFALVYDAAGILVGLVPSSVTSIITLTFRFHLHSYILLSICPIVVFNSVIAARILDKRWHDQIEERNLRRYNRHLASFRRHAVVPSPSSAVITRGGHMVGEPERYRTLSARGHGNRPIWELDQVSTGEANLEVRILRHE